MLSQALFLARRVVSARGSLIGLLREWWQVFAAASLTASVGALACGLLLSLRSTGF
jgi:hypothetical protein